MHTSKFSSTTLMQMASYASVLIAVVLIVVKIVSYFLTNSLSILASLMDSGMDLGASIVSLIAIRQAIQPADNDHRFGHGKAEALGSFIQAVFIILSGLFLFSEAFDHYFNPKPFRHFDVGLIAMVFSIFATFGLILLQRWVIKRTNSLSIRADNAHYTGDIAMNIGVIVSMAFSYYFQSHWIDATFAVVVAFYLIFTAYRITKKVLEILMDKELSDKVRYLIKTTALQHKDVLKIRDLRTRDGGMHHSFVQFCIELNPEISLKQAHAICDELEKELKLKLPKTQIFIHAEPCLGKEN